MSKPICTFATKEGKHCTRPVFGKMLLTATGAVNGTPYTVVGGKKMTGSDRFCENHQKFEEWWPRCNLCRNSKVDPRASKSTAGLCTGCMETGQPKPFTDPVLDQTEMPTQASPWVDVVNKYAKKPLKAAPVNKESPAVAAAMTALEAARKVAQDAEAQVAAAIAAEQAQTAEAAKQKQKTADDRDEIIQIASRCKPKQLDTLVQVARYIWEADAEEQDLLIESFQPVTPSQ